MAFLLPIMYPLPFRSTFYGQKGEKGRLEVSKEENWANFLCSEASVYLEKVIQHTLR